MHKQHETASINLDAFVEDHLNLQVKISYEDHHDFLLRHNLHQCSHVLDIGTGNGLFVSRLALDHPDIQFVGIDKRKQCVESCQKYATKNLDFFQVDMFSKKTAFDFSLFDAFLMRYFLLHVDHSQKIFEFLKMNSKKPARLWIIDLDYSKLTCFPQNKTFDKLTNLIKDFCSKISIDSMGGQKAANLLQKIGYQNIVEESIPFTHNKIALEDLVRYMIQEAQCYSIMCGRGTNDPEVDEILRFIDQDIRAGKFQVSYGMILISAKLNSTISSVFSA